MVYYYHGPADGIARRQFLRRVTVSGLGLGIGMSGVVTGQSDSQRFPRLTEAAGRDWYNSVRQTADGGLLLSGAKETESPAIPDGELEMILKPWAHKLDATGETVWSKTYPSPSISDEEPDNPDKIEQFRFAVPDGSGGYLHVGAALDGGPNDNHTWLVKTNDNGETEWSQWKIQADVNSFTNDFRDGVTTDDGYLLVGRTVGDAQGDERHGEGWVVDLTPSGEVRWSQLYRQRGDRPSGWRDDPEHDEFYAITEAHDSGYLLAGEALGTSDPTAAGWLVALTSEGNKRWERTYRVDEGDLQFNDVIRSGEGYFVAGTAGPESYIASGEGVETVPAGSRGYLFKVDTDGNIEWRYRLGTQCNAVRETGSGAVLVAGQHDGRASAWRVTADGSDTQRLVETDLAESEFMDCVTVGGDAVFVGGTRGAATGFADGLLVTVNNDDGGSNGNTSQNKLTVTKEGVRDGRARFLVASSDGVSAGESGEGITTGTATLDWLGPDRGTDTHFVQGAPQTFLVKGRATVLWNGTVIDPDALGRSETPMDPSELSNNLRIESTGDGMGHYAITTSNGIAPKENSEAATDGYSVLDAVGPKRGVDGYRFSGDINRFLTPGHVQVYVNGSEVDPDDL